MKQTRERPRIVMVDDDAGFRAVVGLWLKDEYDFIGVGDGEQLLVDLEELAPDLIILDLQLPGPDGFSICKALREHNELSSVPVLFFTASIADEDFARGVRDGEAFLVKTVGRKTLLRSIKTLLKSNSSVIL